MNLTDKDLRELRRAHQTTLFPVSHDADMRRMFDDAAARSAANERNAREQREHLLRATARRLDQCEECGSPHGHFHSPTCSVPGVMVIAEQAPGDMYQCHCGQQMLWKVWNAFGCGRCGRKPVGHPEHPAPESNAVPTIDDWKRGDVSAALVEPELTHLAWTSRGIEQVSDLVEPELTPAERTWRAHKGFSR